MTDYISREAAVQAMMTCRSLTPVARLEAVNHIMPVPAADVAPVVHGQWIKRPYLLGTTRYCSLCGENYGMPHAVYNFCPNCGARMDGKEQHETD